MKDMDNRLSRRLVHMQATSRDSRTAETEALASRINQNGLAQGPVVADMMLSVLASLLRRTDLAFDTRGLAAYSSPTW